MTDNTALTKDKVNNIIISLRPCVAQAKVHIIHQLARQVKNLKSKKCSADKQKEQNERKVARYVEEIELLKKSSRDSISRYVLITKRTFSDVVKKESKTQKYNMKVRSYVRVSEHKAVKNVVNQFRYNGDTFTIICLKMVLQYFRKIPCYRDEHGDWEKVLPRLLQTLGKRVKKNKIEDANTTPLNQRNRSSEVEESGEEDEDENENSSPEDDKSDDERDASGSEPEDNTSEEEENGDEEDEAPSDNDVSSDEDDSNIFVASLKEALVKKEKPLKPKVVDKVKVSETSSGDAVVKVLDLKSMSKSNASDSLGVQTKHFKPIESSQKRSSFFLGGESDSDRGEDSEEEGDGGHSSDPDNVEQRMDQYKSRSFHGDTVSSRTAPRDSNSHHYERDSNSGKRKQFQKVTSGKKPKFNKNMDRRSFNSPGGERPRNKVPTKKESEKVDSVSTFKDKPKTNVSVKSVHPSWEAKQKQKPSIQTFQGKKTVFE